MPTRTVTSWPEKLQARITQGLEDEVKRDESESDDKKSDEKKSVWNLACSAGHVVAAVGPRTGHGGREPDNFRTAISDTLVTTVTFTRSDWFATEGSTESPRLRELLDGLWAQRFGLLVDAIRIRVLYDLQKGAIAFGKADAAAEASAKEKDQAVSARKALVTGREAEVRAQVSAKEADEAAETLESAQRRALALDGLLPKGVDGPRPTVEGLERWMQSPVVISCVDHVSVTALLHDKQNGIRAASAPETAPAGSRLVQSAAVVGSRSQAHAVVWQVDQATAVAVKEVHGTLVATVSETVSAQAESGACLVWLPFTT